MNETPFKLSYILASCMYGTMPLVEIVSEVPKIGSQHIDIWPRVHGNQREQVESMGGFCHHGKGADSTARMPVSWGQAIGMGTRLLLA